MSYIDVTGKTESEAIEKALLQLNLDRDDVSVEILERARTGFLGIGSSPAKVRVTYGEEETAAEVGRKPLFTPEKIADKAEKKEEKPQEKKPAVKAAAPVDKDALRRELASKQEVLQNAPAKAEKTEKSEKRRDHSKRERGERKERVAKEVFVPVYEGTEAAADDEKAAAIKNFLTGLLQQMECEAEVKVFEKETHQYKVYLEGEKLGQLIGRRGETLDAIQQLTNYSVNRGNGSRVRVHVDAENYRAKREESLESLAKKMAQKVVKFGRSMTLEPMNAYERHVIHTALQDHPRVTTYSTGTEPNRRVVIAIDRTKAQ
ncbi:MAG: protein jag [Oscillospiraceae bacterium]|nr:protein jag [Oscillospiraceae bacterium]MBR6678639.1 protein jag [Oscillospiraceae bacterium]